MNSSHVHGKILALLRDQLLHELEYSRGTVPSFIHDKNIRLVHRYVIVAIVCAG